MNATRGTAARAVEALVRRTRLGHWRDTSAHTRRQLEALSEYPAEPFDEFLGWRRSRVECLSR